MSDTISRQVAVDAVNKIVPVNTEYDCVLLDILDVRYVLKELPSAGPEIIRCENCKHIQKWRSEESAKKFGQIYECARDVLACPKPDDFCSKAERRGDLK